MVGIVSAAKQNGRFRPVKVGAGGYVTGLSQANDGTLVCRTDTAGAFIFDRGPRLWKQLINPTSFPAATATDRGNGVVEICVAPSNSNYIYLHFQGDIWLSRNKGLTFTATGLNFQTRTAGAGEANAEDASRFMGQKMAVDPNNPDILYTGTPNPYDSLAFDAQTANFTVGQTLTGSTSGATATIISVVDSGTTGTITMTTLTGTFVDNELITDPLGGSATANGGIANKSGIWRTFNAGATWERIYESVIPSCKTKGTNTNATFYPAHPGMMFDANSGTTNGRTNVIFVPTYGVGAYLSEDAGATWTSLASGGPKRISNADIASDGIYYCANVKPTARSVSTASWVGGVVTFTASQVMNIVPGEEFVVTGVTPSGYNGTYIATSGSSSTIVAPLVSNPGSFSSGVGSLITPSVSFAKYEIGSGWADISSGQAMGLADAANAVACDPQDATRIVLLSNGGELQVNSNRGASGSYSITLVDSILSPDIPWLAWTREAYMSVSDIIFDALDSTKLWVGSGIGVARTTISPTPASAVWTFDCMGIENITSNSVICPPNGKPLLAGWDRSTFQCIHPETYATKHSPNNTVAIRMAWDIDYASSDPTFVAYSCYWGTERTTFGYYSTQGGAEDTWTVFAGYPSSSDNRPIHNGSSLILRQGGCIAVSTPDNMIIATSNHSLPHYTLDGGDTWTQILIDGAPKNATISAAVWSDPADTITFTTNETHGIPVGASITVAAVTPSGYNGTYTTLAGTTGTTIVVTKTSDPTSYSSGGTVTPAETGFGFAYYVSSKTVAADRVAANTFYLYNYAVDKCFKSSDGGVTWNAGGATLDTAAGSNSYKLMSVPDNEGHLFISGGSVGVPGDSNPGNTIFQRSTDGGLTWTRIGPSSGDGQIREVLALGFGAAKPGESYPAIYFCGWLQVSGAYQFGIWRSYDNTTSWERLIEWPLPSLSHCKSIDGSKEKYGEIYLAMSGHGYAYRTGD